MDNRVAYDKVFMECFSIERERLNDDLTYESIPEWDSVGHMAMVAGLEDCFDIVLEMDDIIDFSSYKAGMGIMAKYNIVV